MVLEGNQPNPEEVTEEVLWASQELICISGEADEVDWSLENIIATIRRNASHISGG